MKTYSEKLKDPRWQRRRLKVLEWADFTCELCGDKTTTLEVHHLHYNEEPWEAHKNGLECLCSTCHKIRPNITKLFSKWFDCVPANAIKDLFFLAKVDTEEGELVAGLLLGAVLKEGVESIKSYRTETDQLAP